jgi:alkanesulfonate monooxygenase SsuD/methylene tetrahydromethanopterin reductase-like flavin-dependent oxidoreductase (luciferase family)
VWVICADTEEEARRLESSSKMAFTLLQRGELLAVPTIERAERFLAEQGARPPGPGRARRRITGAPATVRAGIEAVAKDYGADEVMIVTITWDHEARRRSYGLIAEAFGLDGAPMTDDDALTGAVASVGRHLAL